MKWGEWKWHKIGISRPPMSSIGPRPLLFFIPKFFLYLFIPLLRLCWNPYLLKQQYRAGVTNLYRTKTLSPPQLKKWLLQTIYKNCLESFKTKSTGFIWQTCNAVIWNFYCKYLFTLKYHCGRIYLYHSCVSLRKNWPVLQL